LLIVILIIAPWTINNSGSLNIISKIENNSIGNYQSTTCTYSFFEFLVQNPENNYLINIDKSATIDCFSKINGADKINEIPVVYVGTNLNLDFIIQAIFWLVLFSLIPKHKKYNLEFKNISIFISIILILIHFSSEKAFYSFNSKIFSTDWQNNYLLYSIILTCFIILKILSDMVERRIKNILYFIPFIFVVSGTFNSSNLNIIYLFLMFIGIIALFKYLGNKLFFVLYLPFVYFWISSIENNIAFFDVDKIKGFTSSAYNLNSVFFWSYSFLFFMFGFLFICNISINEIDIIKLRLNFLLSGSLVVLFSVISALHPAINFLTYYYLGLNKTASKTFESVEGNAWRGISPSAESIGEFYAFVILLTIVIAIYKKNYSLSVYEVCFLLINCFGLYKSNNFAALISLIVFTFLLFLLVNVTNKKIKFLSIFSVLIFFPIVYFLFFNTYSLEESSRKLLKESFAVSNIEYLSTNQFGQTPIDENRFYEVILSEESDEKISTSLNYLVSQYHFSKRNSFPNITTLISSVASPINRSEKWGVFFGKYNPSFSTLLIGTGPNNIVDYYFGHDSKANYGLILPHSSVLSLMIFFGLFGISVFLLWCSYKLISNRHNPYYFVLVFFFLINLLKSDSLLYINSFLLFIFIFNVNHVLKPGE